MTQSYRNQVEKMDTLQWNVSAVDVNIPEHPEYRISSPSGRFEVEISPVNGYDDGNLHEDNLEFFVNVYEYDVDDDGERLEEIGHVFGRKKKTASAAVELAEQKVLEYDN